MTKEELLSAFTRYMDESPENYLSAKIAIKPELSGMRMFETPIMGVSRADHEYFAKFRDPNVVSADYLLPSDWLTGAKSVVSFFFPQGEVPRKTNREDRAEPAAAWLHTRIEGQMFINGASKYLCSLLESEGYEAVAPSVDPRFASGNFKSNWSERHTAYVCGLGTFGLSKGLITEKGVCGRFTSIITTAVLEPTPWKYKGIYDNCTMCGACVRMCPAGAISIEKGKDHVVCSAFLNGVKARYAPRYGCGKCQVAVPCETRIPQKRQ